MPLTPTFQSAFQSAYRSGFTHNAGVFNSKRLDLSTNHDSSDTTISDRSPYGNDATLKSGVYFSTNGLTDKGINADCSAAGSGTYKLTGKVRSASTGTKYVTMDGATGDTLTVNTADVWEDFESTEFTGTPSNVVISWDGGSNFSACDWSDIRLIDISDGSTVAHWQGNDSAAGNLDGKLVADSSGNGYHGKHIDCAGGSGEPDILQTAGQNANQRLWYDGVDDSIDTGSNCGMNVQQFTYFIDLVPAGTNTNYARIIANENGGDGIAIGVISDTNLYLYDTSTVIVNDFFEAYTRIRFAITRNGGGSTWRVCKNGTFLTNPVGGAATLDYGANNLMFFARPNGTIEWKGLAIEAAAYSTILSDATIEALTAGTLAPDEVGETPKVHYRFNVQPTLPDLSGNDNDGTVNGSPDNHYIPQSDSDNSIDAVGAAIANPRPNNKVINLLADDAKATIAADASMDVTKTIEGWVYYDGTDQTFLDIGTPIINSSSDVLGSTLAGSLTYYVNGVATTALGSAGWKYIVIASDTAQATDAIDILATSAAWKMIDRTLTAAEVLARFNTTKAQYGF